MHSHRREFRKTEGGQAVLILVVMEDALAQILTAEEEIELVS